MRVACLSLLALAAIAGCDRPAAPAPAKMTAPAAFYAQTFRKTPRVAAMTELGRLLFHDAGLSASGKLSCASCHDPAYAYGPPNARAVQLGGGEMNLSGTRAVPSIRYLQQVPSFTEHYFESEGGGADQGPTGGYTWDGRATSLHDQARLPLLSPLEMANADEAALLGRVRGAAYASGFQEAFGDDVFSEPARAFKAVLMALEVFQQDPAEFSPYSSKYDAFLRGRARLSAQEKRGLRWFNEPAKGNCASCHPSTMRQGALPSFSDWGFNALGVPRNRKIPANTREDFYDLGLCGPGRRDYAARAEYCGLFRTPSLRNVALRKAFFHNGVFASLEQVLAFYVERDLRPEKFYPRERDGGVRKFDDLPPVYHHNINREPPFGREPGQAPALSKAESRDVIAFLQTLTDGYEAPPRGASGGAASRAP